MSCWAVVLPPVEGTPGEPWRVYAGVARAVRAAQASGIVERVLVASTPDLHALCAALGAEPVSVPREGAAVPQAGLELAARAVRDEPPSAVVVLVAGDDQVPVGSLRGVVEAVRGAGAPVAFWGVDVPRPLWRVDSTGVRRLDQPEQWHVADPGRLYAVDWRGWREHGESLLESMLPVVGVTPAGAPAGPGSFAGVGLLALDFDGVMTDNVVVVDETGREAVRCSRGDGMGITLLREAGVPCVVISKERNPVVAARCRKLGIPCYQGIDDKLAVLVEVAKEHGVSPESVAYVGNDVNDLECMAWCGVAVAVADAELEVLRAAHVVTVRPGGRGAVRDVTDWILAARRLGARQDGG